MKSYYIIHKFLVFKNFRENISVYNNFENVAAYRDETHVDLNKGINFKVYFLSLLASFSLVWYFYDYN